MSDQPLAEGWWQASDGKWYPPEQSPAPPPPPPPPAAGAPLPQWGSPQAPTQPWGNGQQFPPQSPPAAPKKGGCLKVGLIVAGVFLALIVVGGIISAVSGGSKSGEKKEAAETSTTTSVPSPPKTTTPEAPAAFTTPQAEAGRNDGKPNSGKLFAGRPDTQPDDYESAVPGAIRMEGRTVVVTSAQFQQSISEFESNGYLKASATIVNRDKEAQSYNLFDWRLQTPAGTVINPTFTTANALGSGDLVGGGVVTGDLYFEVGAQKGDFYLIYKPDPFDSKRGIWKVPI